MALTAAMGDDTRARSLVGGGPMKANGARPPLVCAHAAGERRSPAVGTEEGGRLLHPGAGVAGHLGTAAHRADVTILGSSRRQRSPLPATSIA